MVCASANRADLKPNERPTSYPRGEQQPAAASGSRPNPFGLLRGSHERPSLKRHPDRNGGVSTARVRSKPRAPTAPSVPVGEEAHGTTDARWSLLVLRPCSPFRPPNWRTLLAAEITGHPDRRVATRLTRWADDRVLDLVRLGKQPPPGHPLAVARYLQSPDRYRVRLEVEARLLAGQPDAAIASATGVGAVAVGWFHDVAFDCRPRLRHPSAVVHTFLARTPGEDDPMPLAWVVRRYAYFGGVHVLEELLRLLDDPAPALAAAADRSAASLRRAAARAACRAAVLVRLLPDDLGGCWRGQRLAARGAVGGDRAVGRGLMTPLTPPDGLRSPPAAGSCKPGGRMGKLVEVGADPAPPGGPTGATQRVGLTTVSARVRHAARARPLLEGRL